MDKYKLVPVEPSPEMDDLVKRLRIKAGMIELGELIAWGSDSALMREAADALERLAAPDMQGEPVAWSGWGCQHPGKMPRLYGERRIAELNCDWENGDQLLHFTAAQHPAVQQPAPDVTQLVDALESLIKGYVGLLEAGKDRITSLGGDCDPVPVMEKNDPWLRGARAALTAYRNQGANP